MRWDNLFDDLESQLEQEIGAEDLDLLAEEERLRLGRLSLRDRLRAMMPTTSADEPLRLLLVDGTRIAVDLGAVGRDWIAGEVCGDGIRLPSCVIPIAAIAGCLLAATQSVASVNTASEAGVGTLAARLGLAFVLRDLCRRRASVHILTAAGMLHGTIDRVGRDHLDLAEHEPGVPRRDRAIRVMRLLPVSELVLVRF
ncbi:MAG: hypothetical protein ABIQ01_09550 [Pseudolysinimonas sp.]